MRTYVLRRLLLFVPTLLGASLLIFVLMRLVPGDIAEILVYQTGSESSAVQKRQIEQIRRELGLDRAVVTLLLAALWSIPLGVVSAVRQNTWLDYLVRVLSISGLSLPIFFTGVLILYLLVRVFRWLPPLEYVSFTVSPLENLKQLIWPALVQAYYISAPITRLTRSQLLEVIREDYVR